MDTTADKNIFVVSNRLPVRVERAGGRYDVIPSAGGLAAALRSVTGVRSWIGWPGGTVELARRQQVQGQLAELSLQAVFLTAEEERTYYTGMCNGTLWPLVHYFPGRIEFDDRAWPAYAAVNRRFAAAIATSAGQGDVVWIHDFHLMLVPQLLRAERPDLRIGYFLHVPFPSQELWRVLPQRDELLRGVLGADYVSFHTADYLRNFRDACLRILGIEAGPDAIVADGRRVGLGVDPLGADTTKFIHLLQGQQMADEMKRLAEQWQGRRLVLGVERLDYSKGILHKLQAFARLLELEPERCSDTVMLQVLVPSREENESYKSLLREIQREVGRINGRFGKPGVTPLEFVHGSVEPAELAALYRFAAVGFVAPVRDGMNLVAHEFVLCQGHEHPEGSKARGVLVLSEFAGASLSLVRALQVNPWDIGGLASALSGALRMTPDEKLERTTEMYERVTELDSAHWAQRFLRRLDKAAARNLEQPLLPVEAKDRVALRQQWRSARRRRVFLDYDGTLREITQQPELAAPTAELIDVLRRLCAYPDTEVHIVSGRRRTTLGAWLGQLPVHLCAEHGFAVRPAGGVWTEPLHVDRAWMPRVHEVLIQTCDQVPGSFIERKGCGFAWHYRLADPGYGSWRAQELRLLLDQILAGQPAETLAGHAVLEVRAEGVDKGAYVAARLPAAGSSEFVLIAGDDRTDIDMYRRAPAGAAVVNVGARVEAAEFVARTPAEFRRLLAELVVA